MKEKSIKVNAILNMIRIAMGILFPMITFPYANNILGASILGKVTYSASIVSYFSLFAALGVTRYAVREGSKIRNDRQKITTFVNEVLSLNLITTIIAYIGLFIGLFTIAKLQDYTLIILISSSSIFFTTIGVEWLNSIYEDYLYITVRSIAIHIITLICFFVFIRQPSDYIKYTVLTVLTSGIICVTNMFYCRKYVKFKFYFSKKILKHLRPMLVFFSNALAISIYVNSDITMLGWIYGDFYTGLYSAAVKVYQIVKQILTALYTVTIPRLSKLSEQEDLTDFRNLLTDLCSSIMLLILPAGVGMIVLSKEIITIAGGGRAEFLGATHSLEILACALLFSVVGGILVNCINTPLRKEVISLKATIIAAIANVLLNLIFIPWLKHDGAAITTAISEFIVCAYCVIKLKNINLYVNIKELFYHFCYALGGSIWIVVAGIITSSFTSSIVIKVPCVMFLSFIGYALILYIGKNTYVMNIINKKTKKKLPQN